MTDQDTLSFANKHRDDPTGAVVFFERAYQSYLAAEQAAGPRQFEFLAGEFVVRVRLAGDALLEPITRALQHLVPARDATPSLTICVWDERSTGVPLLALPFEGSMVTRRGDLAGYNTSRIIVALDRSAGTLSLLDRERNLALFCTRDGRRLPTYEMAAPLKTILYWWLRERQHYFVHAGAIGTEQGGILLVGKGGSGKSTTALAALASDLEYVSDDYCVVSHAPGWSAWNLYNSAKVTPTSLQLLPHLQPLADASALRVDDKHILFLDETYSGKLARKLTLRAIVLPRVTGRPEPRLVPTTPNAALSALAISTLLQLPNAGDETLRALERLTHDLPCYVLELGDVNAVPSLIRSLLEHSSPLDEPSRHLRQDPSASRHITSLDRLGTGAVSSGEEGK